ncbi:hypothetical protein ABMA27_003963 [Loxostege sticticalis]|uniref:Regulatory protein zeste n=1 Tax=Loxostege sticticalis TaxID=481309 RepID=A0ABR3HQZ7_LOXSC
MESGKRSKNFTEREKMLLIEIAKEFVSIIDNKKTDMSTVEKKKRAWLALTKQYNAFSDTGPRTEKQLHALYDNLKKRARKNMADDKSEMCKSGGTFCFSKTAFDENVKALLTPHLKSMDNEFDPSEPYYVLNVQTSTDTQGSIEDTQTGSIADSFLEMEVNEGVETVDSSINCPKTKIPASTFLKDVETTPKLKNNMCLTETTKKNINNISASIIKRKIQKQINEDAISKKKLDILEIQRQQELIKLEKNKVILDLDIELKRVLLENAKIDLECKKKMYNL